MVIAFKSGQDINGDLSLRVAVDTSGMRWMPSPSRTVWRKRVHLVGPAEAGQVTSIVRYDPGATFPLHDHPGGEEIFVLEGVFSDEHGDWPAGTYLLNPEGFQHAPFSKEGCLLFVKLRQFAGKNREHVVVRTQSMRWQPTIKHGVDIKALYAQPGFEDSMHLEHWASNTRLGLMNYPGGAEIFVLEGELADESGAYSAGTWLRLPRGASHRPMTDAGCTLYLKLGGLRYLDSGC